MAAAAAASPRGPRADVRVVDFDGSPQHTAAFQTINAEWISELFTLEPHDVAVLADPPALVRAGGSIFVAVEGATVLGVCALLAPAAAGEGLELAKMGVRASARGRGVGRALGEAAVAAARARGAPRVDILSNRGLTAALALYASLGFVERPLPATDYARADIYLELVL